MSRTNREKRAAKARARRAAAASGGPGGRTTAPGHGARPHAPPGPTVSPPRADQRDSGPDSGGGPSPLDDRSIDVLVDVLLLSTDRAYRLRDRTSLLDAIGRDLPGFAAEVASRLRHSVAGLWASGWQPNEAVRHVRRGCGSSAVRLLLAAIAVDHAGRAPSTIDPRWSAQIASLDLPQSATFDRDDGSSTGAAWVRCWMDGEDASTSELVAAAGELLVRLMTMPAIEALIAPPGAGPDWQARVAGSAASTGASSAGAEADPVLEKVRALLAKAESTSFEAEAEAFTAKAQQLIARHAIDVARLAVDDGDDGPSAIRVFIDDPYGDAKAVLLHVVAESGRCRSVSMGPLAMSTVVGFPSDLAATEMMFTSLLVQAQTALAAAARTAPPGSRPRSRGFRSAFLQSYAARIGQRLAEINQAVVAESEAASTTSILPVLASREVAVDGAVDDLFTNLTTRTRRGGVDAAGWASGRLAADNAELGGGSVTSGGAQGAS